MDIINKRAVAVLIAVLLASPAAMPVFAAEPYGPGYRNGVAIEQASGQTGSQNTNQDMTVIQGGGISVEQAEAALASGGLTIGQEAEGGGEDGTIDEAMQQILLQAQLASLPRLLTTMVANNLQTQTFLNDAYIHADGAGMQNMVVYLENIVGNVLYRTYTGSLGWSQWMMNGQQTPIYPLGTYIEAIEMRFSGYVGNRFDLYYTAVLEDGTAMGWAKNGQASGTMGTGHYITGFRIAFFGKDTEFPYSTSNILISAHEDGIQWIDGQMRYISGDGSNHTGWGWLGNDRYYFIDSYPVTDWQYIDGYKYYFDETGKMLSDLEPIIGAPGPFLIMINKQMNTMTIYVQDGANGFIIPLKTFLTSTGNYTPIGTFHTPEKYRWRDMNHGIYTQYATRITKGFLIHSILYSRPNGMTLNPDTYNYLSVAKSSGCVRLLSAHAKWVFDHCPLGTTVTIYNSPVPGPYERPAIEWIIPRTQTWDPTDPDFAHLNAQAAEGGA
ncbi:MAG: L,D-transpeptidase family protein [Lachnospiraceae bacterium]|jgi:hypothetical protein|nr:L,D-transpeptidase family protein [Lachnospiraceae bacterium]